MRARRKKIATKENARLAGHSAEEKIARVLGLLLIKDVQKKTNQVPLLRSAGFDVAEIADMLGMTENHVMVADHLGRKKRASN